MFKRTINLFFGVLLAICSGSTMIYPIYSYHIKTKFNFSLRAINLYGTFINIGVWVAFIMGIIYDSLGPKKSNAITLVLLSGGYLLLYKLIQTSSCSLFWFLLVALIIGQGGALAYTNTLSTNVKNFSKSNSSNIVGLIISNCAIAPSIFTSVKSSFNTMSINSYLIFILCYISIIIAICIFWFDIIKQKRRDDLNQKLFYEFKQKFIIYIFGYANFISLLVFIGILLINHIFGIEIPAFIAFIIIHIVFIIFVIMEWKGHFDNWLHARFNRTHRQANMNSGNNNFDVSRRSVEVMVNNQNSEKNDNYGNNVVYNNININKDKKEDDDDDEENKRYTQSENISKLRNKFDLAYQKEIKDNNNKSEHSLDININKSLLRKSLDQKDQNKNINNVAENNQEANGRISIESDINNNEEKKEEEFNNKNDKEENKEEEEKENNINNNKEEKLDISNLENSINKINNLHPQEENNNINNNNDDNNNSIDNGAKKQKFNNEDKKIDGNENENNLNEKENSKEEEKIEKIDDNQLNYPKFSLNSSNNNNNEEIKEQNNYPKFSISSEKTEEENPYKEKEEIKPKFSVIDNKEDEIEENNNIKDNKSKNNKDDEIKNEENQEKHIKNKELNKTPIKQQNIKNNNYPNVNTDFNFLVLNTNTYMNNDNNNNNNINTSISPLNNTTHSFLLENEKDDDNSENYGKCAFLLSLFRRPQIMLLFTVLALTMGSMISNVNNIKYIIVSIYSDQSISSTSLDKYPLIYFSFNSLSRVIVGKICNTFMGTDETFLILVTITTMGLISQILGLFIAKFFIYLSISLAGMTHGGIMTFVPLYCRYYFSVKNLGTVLGFLTTGNAIGSIFIATLIFPIYYHRYSIIDKNGEEICNRITCFWYSYAINCLFTLTAVGISYYIYVRDKNKKIQERNNQINKYRNCVNCSSNN